MRRLLKELYSTVNNKVVLGDIESEWFNQDNGVKQDVSCHHHFSLLWWKTSLIFWYCFLTYKRVTICRRRRPNGRNQRENYMKWRIQRTHDKTIQHESELGILLSESCNSWVPGRRPGWPPSQWDFMLYRLLSLSCMIQAVIYLIHCHVV